MTGVLPTSTLLLHFISRRPDGEVFEDTSKGEPVLVTLGKKQINPAFEEALLGRAEGETVTVILPPEKAYGRYHRKLVVTVKRKKLTLDHEPAPGELIRVEVMNKPCLVTVVSVTDKSVTVDANHPLAGETITYEITIVKILEP
ncbi:FKBP-type 16 kDa peptidyl-prolyl cis-trans isomerase [Methanocorpusculaceae archaeon Sp1]|nr:FKBP-type 16 kDa peptidyl-prolyl cis-trans isomerase [Methanocorpusculaceae archaeon Sp1]